MTASNLKVNDVRPFIGCRDFDSSRDFYVALGWKVTFDSADLRVLELGNHRFYLQRYYNKVWCENLMLHIAVENVDAWHEFVERQFAENTFAGEARISGKPKDEGYARVFHVWDPAGVLLHFAQFAAN
ncbi:MAG: hypothetical protein R3C19_14750 [Planctomycetaceae bacterium]